MPGSTKERGGSERPAEGGRNIRKDPSKSTSETPGFGRHNRALAPQLRLVAGWESPTYKRRAGEVPEWSIGTVSKTVVRASVPWVRIPPSPPVFRPRLPEIWGLSPRGGLATHHPTHHWRAPWRASRDACAREIRQGLCESGRCDCWDRAVGARPSVSAGEARLGRWQPPTKTYRRSNWPPYRMASARLPPKPTVRPTSV